MVNLPHFIHIGFPKTASTWLQDLFASHKEICFVYKPKFFHWDDCFQKGKEFYLSMFNKNSSHKILLDSDEQYSAGIRFGPFGWDCCYKPQHSLNFAERARKFSLPLDRDLVAKRIHQILPNAKIMMVLRNQADWLASRYKHYLIKGESRSFGDFIKDKDVLDPAFYAPLVELYFGLFGRNNILVLFYEELVKNPPNFLNKISDFFGISKFDSGIISKKSRIGLTNRGAKIIQKINFAAQKISTIKPAVRPISYFDRILFRKLKDASLISQKDRQFLSDLYADDNKKLAELLGCQSIY